MGCGRVVGRTRSSILRTLVFRFVLRVRPQRRDISIASRKPHAPEQFICIRTDLPAQDNERSPADGSGRCTPQTNRSAARTRYRPAPHGDGATATGSEVSWTGKNVAKCPGASRARVRHSTLTIPGFHSPRIGADHPIGGSAPPKWQWLRTLIPARRVGGKCHIRRGFWFGPLRRPVAQPMLWYLLAGSRHLLGCSSQDQFPEAQP